MKLAPSILSADFANLKQDIDRLLPYTDYLHIDVMDGSFVPNISIGIPVVKSIRPHYDILFDTHLMIDNPIKYVKPFKEAGSDLITFHVEATEDKTQETIDEIKKYGMKVGLSIKPKTPVSAIYDYLSELDLVLVMSVEPGFGGQKFDPTSLPKIKELAELKKKNGYKYEIEVDGGINGETAKLVLEAGAEVLVSGSYLFLANDLKEAVEKMTK